MVGVQVHPDAPGGFLYDYRVDPRQYQRGVVIMAYLFVVAIAVANFMIFLHLLKGW
jgi:hypothetical protein